MAKRRTAKIAARAQRKLAKEAGMHAKGKSNYALKKKGQREPKQDPARRPSWMIRHGLVWRAERAAANDSINVAA